MSAKQTSWNEFSSAMASAVICLATGRTFNFSKYIFESLNQLGDLSTHSTKYISPGLTQKVFANMRRVGKGCSGVETPLFEGMLIAKEPENQGTAEEQGTITSTTTPISTSNLTIWCSFPYELTSRSIGCMRLRKVRTSQRIESSADTIMEDVSNQGRMTEELDKDEGAKVVNEQEKTEEVRVNAVDAQVEGRQESRLTYITLTWIMLLKSSVVAAVNGTVSAAAVVPAPVTAATVTPAPVKDKGKGILIEESKPMKKKQQVELDEAYARKLQEEFNQDIDWETTIEHVKQKAKEEPFIQRYQVMKKRPQTEAQARQNMMMYLKNTAGLTLDFFKGISYDDILPIFEAKFNENLKFLLKSKEQIKEEESRAIALINETPA
nr:hypothetical protein [Tanacetum cinerariifolium]